MDFLESLGEDHRLIADALDALDGFLDTVERQGNVDRDDLTAFATILADFVDALHHYLEEELLVPAMVRSGVDWEGPVLKRLREDHEQERYLLRTVEQSAHQRPHWTAEDRRHLVSVGRELTAFLRRHGKMEGQQVFSVAGERLSAASLDSLAQRRSEIEKSDDRGSWAEMIERLRQKYAAGEVPRA